MRRCLAKAPADRPRDLGAVAATLRELAARAGGVRAPPGARAGRAAPPARCGARDRAAVDTHGRRPARRRSNCARRGSAAGWSPRRFVILLLGAGFVFFLLPRWVERSAGTPATAAPPAVPAEPAPAPAEPQKDLERLAAAKRDFEELRPTVAAAPRGARGPLGRRLGRRRVRARQARAGRCGCRLRAARARGGAREPARGRRRPRRDREARGGAAARRAVGRGRGARAGRCRSGARAVRAGAADRARERRGEARPRAHGHARRGDGACWPRREPPRSAATARRPRPPTARRWPSIATRGRPATVSRACRRRPAAPPSPPRCPRASTASRAATTPRPVRPSSVPAGSGPAHRRWPTASRRSSARSATARSPRTSTPRSRPNASERWAEALAEYRKALAVDRNLALAQQGVERAEPRAMLDAELKAYLERPERLFSPDVRAAARTAVARARGFGEPGSALDRQIAAVEALITAAETPQRVALTSDNQTDVTVYRVGRIGTFERKELELLPGRYTVVGMRAGFRDVRRELTLLPGREAPDARDPLRGADLSPTLILREPLGERVLGPGDFPLSLGGTGADVVVPSASGTLAWIGLHDGQLFVQPADEASAVLHNGTPVAGSTWLRSGDVLDAGGGRLKLRLEQGRRVLEVVAGGAGNATAPPAAETAATVGGLAAGEDERIEPVAFRRPDAVRAPPPRTVPWRRLATGRGARVAHCDCGGHLYVGARAGRDRPGAGTGGVRGRLARPALRHQPPAAAGRLHAGRRARGLRAARRARRDHDRPQPAAQLRAAAVAGPPRGRAAGAREREHRRPAGRRSAGPVRAGGGASHRDHRHRALPRRHGRSGDRGTRPTAEARARSSRPRGPRSRSPRSPPARKCASAAKCEGARR